MPVDRDKSTKAAREDAIVVRAVLGGDRSAYGELYDRYGQLIRAICFDTTRDVIETQDLSQEVFLRAFSARHRPSRPASTPVFPVSQRRGKGRRSEYAWGCIWLRIRLSWLGR